LFLLLVGSRQVLAEREAHLAAEASLALSSQPLELNAHGRLHQHRDWHDV
jgi:hypothetical protein